MLEQVLRHIHNRFDRAYLEGAFEVSSGTCAVDEAQDGQYLWIEGSVFNDGLHQYPLAGLTDEEFGGRIYLLAVPKALLELVDEIEDWQSRNGSVADGPYQSESFGGYSYTRASDGSGGSGGLSGWQAQFASRLNPWRKLS